MHLFNYALQHPHANHFHHVQLLVFGYFQFDMFICYCHPHVFFVKDTIMGED
jgi:hypothetical protein